VDRAAAAGEPSGSEVVGRCICLRSLNRITAGSGFGINSERAATVNERQRIEALINSGILDSDGRIMPTAQDSEEVERTHPNDSDADKFRRMQAQSLVKAATHFCGRVPSMEELEAFAGLLNKHRNCSGTG
jgi:hypothetical protein